MNSQIVYLLSLFSLIFLQNVLCEFYDEKIIELPSIRYGLDDTYSLRLLQKKEQVSEDVYKIYKDLQSKEDGFFSFLRGWNEILWGDITKNIKTNNVRIWFRIPSINLEGNLDGDFSSLSNFRDSHLTLKQNNRVIKEYYTIPAADNFSVDEYMVNIEMAFPNNCLQFAALICDRSRKCMYAGYTIFCNTDL